MSNVRFKIKDELCSTTANRLRAGVVTIAYKEFIDQQNHPDNIYRDGDIASEIEYWQEVYFEYRPNNKGHLVPVLVLPTEEVYPEFERDKFYFISKATIDGIVYDKWQKIEQTGGLQVWNSSAKQFIYTTEITAAATFNNFGLAERTLKTANRWCTSDIAVKINSAELTNINSEYIRCGITLFGVDGVYGNEPETITIPAGIYEIIFNPTDIADARGIPFYHRGIYVADGFYYGFNGNIIEGISGVAFNAGSSASEPSGSREASIISWLDYLVLVPNDATVSKATAEAWYMLMHPYVSCIDYDFNQEISETALAKRILATLIPDCEHAGDKTYVDNNDGTHKVICNQCSEVLSDYSPHEYNEGYCWCGATSGSTCEHANWVYYEGDWSTNSSEYDRAQYECQCTGCQCNFRTTSQGDTWSACPCCGGVVEFIGYVGGDDGDGGGGEDSTYECPICGCLDTYDGNVCSNCGYGEDNPFDSYLCWCGAPITNWDEYPYTGRCSESEHFVNLHDPEYCSHQKIEWSCNDSDCGSSGTCCEWIGDADYGDWVSHNTCPRCQLSTVSTN